ncbi:DUF6300 family protein (plasmid) [Streptomyces sp. NBC_01220]|uniref:DUF6300 family protein n=1 Tax=Streptomyces sp. NBC_01220 TaxID=2903781 RepID=UPI00352F0068|nr:DUF6300 family protein [Streptomyces sp. NBC_01220]
MSDAGEQDIVLRVDDPPPCPRCGRAALLHVQFPHPWNDASSNGGERAGSPPAGPQAEDVASDDIHALREAVLCPVCDRGEPAADGLLAFFAVHATLLPGQLETFHALVIQWVDVVRGRQVDQVQLDNEFERWRSGNL